MTEERLKLHEKAEVRINAIIDTLSQDKGGLANKLKQEDVKDFLMSLWVDCAIEATKKLEKENAELKDALEGYKQNAKWCDKCDKFADLKKENEELKEKLKPENCLKLLAKEGYIKFTSDKLTKAKDLLAKWVELYKPKSNTALPTPIQVDTEQFLNSEVKK